MVRCAGRDYEATCHYAEQNAEQTNEVDERGMDAPASTPVGPFLQLALATYNRKTKVRGPRSELMVAHRDDGAAVFLINPDMMTAEQRMSLV
jgi:hypothetical protein